MLKKLLRNMHAQKREQRLADLYRNLIRREAKVGGTIFGDVEKGRRREFFCLDEHTWVWHEEWTDKNGQHQVKTTRYDIRPTGILKSQDGQPTQYVSLEEGERLVEAFKLYNQRVDEELYSFI